MAVAPASDRARIEALAPLIADLEQWMRAERAALSRHAPVAKAMDYMLNRWDGFTAFPRDGRVCLSARMMLRRGFLSQHFIFLFLGACRQASELGVTIAGAPFRAGSTTS